MALGWVYLLLFICLWLSHHIPAQPSHSGLSTLKTQNLVFPFLELPICFHFKGFLMCQPPNSFSPIISQTLHLCILPNICPTVNFHLLGFNYMNILTYPYCSSVMIMQSRAALSDQLPSGLHYISKFLVPHILLWIQVSLDPFQEPLPDITLMPAITF